MFAGRTNLITAYFAVVGAGVPRLATFGNADAIPTGTEHSQVLVGFSVAVVVQFVAELWSGDLGIACPPSLFAFAYAHPGAGALIIT